MLKWISHSMRLHTWWCTAWLVCHLHSYFWLVIFYLSLGQLTGIDKLSESVLSGKLNEQVVSDGLDQKIQKENHLPLPKKLRTNTDCLTWSVVLDSAMLSHSASCLLITILEELFLWALFHTILPVVAKWDSKMSFCLNFGMLWLHHKSLCPKYFHLFVTNLAYFHKWA